MSIHAYGYGNVRSDFFCTQLITGCWVKVKILLTRVYILPHCGQISNGRLVEAWHFKAP